MIKNIKKYLVAFIVAIAIAYKLLFAGSTYVEYEFRNENLLAEHYKKHGQEMNCSSEEEYLKKANAVINNKDALHKLEAEDGDDVYYLEETNELVIVSTDGYIRTYFLPDNGKAFFDKQ